MLFPPSCRRYKRFHTRNQWTCHFIQKWAKGSEMQSQKLSAHGTSTECHTSFCDTSYRAMPHQEGAKMQSPVVRSQRGTKSIGRGNRAQRRKACVWSHTARDGIPLPSGHVTARQVTSVAVSLWSGFKDGTLFTELWASKSLRYAECSDVCLAPSKLHLSKLSTYKVWL